MPAFDLALCLRMVGRAPNVSHVLCIQPICQLSRDVAGTIIAEQARLMDNPSLVTAGDCESKIQRVGHVLRLHRRAQLPGDDVAREVIQYRTEIETAPA